MTLSSNSRRLLTTTPVANDDDDEDAVAMETVVEGEEIEENVKRTDGKFSSTDDRRGSGSKQSLMPRPPSGPSGRRRPQSAGTSLRQHHYHSGSDGGGARGYTNSSESIHKDSGAGGVTTHRRPKSARTKSLKISTVALDYGADGGSDSDVQHKDKGYPTGSAGDDFVRKESKIKKRPEIETMMSRMALSDEEDHQDSAKTSDNTPEYKNVQYSSTPSDKTNFYKAATAPANQQALLTTKTMAFTDSGILESKYVSKIGQVQMAEKKPPIIVGRIGMQRSHSAITRPVMKSNTSVSSFYNLTCKIVFPHQIGSLLKVKQKLQIFMK